MKRVLRNCLLAGLMLMGCRLFGAGGDPSAGASSTEPEPASSRAKAPKVEGLSPETSVEFVGDVVRFSNRVVVTYEDIRLTAENVTIHQESGEIEASGDVRIQQGPQVWQGERLSYNYRTRTIGGEDFKLGAPPFFASGEKLGGERTNDVYHAHNAVVTADDIENPVYKIKAETLIVVPGEYIEAYNATAYLGNVPVGYWFHYKRRLHRHPNNIVLTPGYRSLYGPYLLSTYNWYVNTNLSGGLHMDYRQRRGVAGGPDIQYKAGKLGAGEFKYYVARDDEPGTNSLARMIDNPRSRLSWSHRTTIRTNLEAKAVVRWQSDEFIVRDFFEYEYRENIQPSTFLEVNQLWPNFSLNVLAMPQVNDFYETIERLPDIKFSAAPQQLGRSPLYYESDSSIGYYRHQFANNFLPEYAAWRGDSFHQVTLPRTLFGWLTVEPRVGGRYTHYGESDGAGIPFREEDRWVFNTGMEVSFKASRLWKGARSKFWQVDGLRHIVEPSVNYAYVPEPSPLPPALPQFDPLLPSFRLLPFEFPEFNAIDGITGKNAFRFGLRNKVQTKRDEEIVDLLHWAVFTDWNVTRLAGQKTYSDVFSDLDFQPWRTVVLTSRTRYDIDNGVFQQADHTLTYQPNTVWSVSAGHRYLREVPALGIDSGHNLISGNFYLRMNENWGFGTQHHFEARDGTLEEQYYTIYRDLRSWTSALTFRLRDSRGSGVDDFTVAITFSLKAFPRFGLGEDRVRPSLLLGG